MKKSVILKILFLFTCFIALLLFTNAEKYYSNFKRVKKEVDTLVLLTPYVEVEFSKGQSFSKDFELSEVLAQQIFDNSHSLLDKKYTLARLASPLDSMSENELSDIFSILDSSSKLTELPTPPFIQNRIKSCTNRYLLFIAFNGYYNADFPPYYRVSGQGSVGIGGGSATSVSIVIHPYTIFFNSDMRVIIFDNQDDKIVFYNKKYSKDTDPRLPKSVEKMTLDILKSVYYK